MQLNPDTNATLKYLKLVPIKPFKEISIGDPTYFEDLDAEERVPGTIDKKLKKTLKEMTLDTKTSCCKTGMIAISEVEEDLGFENHRYSYITLDVALSSKAKLEEAVKDFEVYLTDRHYVNSSKATHELACDTAQFIISVDGRYDEVDTGADGYYGYANELKQYFGFQLSLTFDSDLFNVDEIERLATYWFQKDTKLENKPEIGELETSIKDYLNETLEIERQ